MLYQWSYHQVISIQEANAEGAQAPDVTSLHMPMDIGETKENRDNTNLESEIESESLEVEWVVDPPGCSDDQVAVVGDVPNKGWPKLHCDEVKEMLDFEAESKQYYIQCHYFINRKLCLVVRDRISETTIDEVDYKCDFPHVLAFYIHSKKFHGDSSKTWMEWADKHFKQVRRLVCM